MALNNEVILSDSQKYIEIKQGEYRRLKRDDPKNYHSYTARVRFKYFKLKDKKEKDIPQEMINAFLESSAELLIKLQEIKENAPTKKENEGK